MVTLGSLALVIAHILGNFAALGKENSGILGL